MAAVFAVADVQNARIIHSNQNATVENALSSLLTLFAPDVPPTSLKGTDRAQKRRKLDGGKSTAIHSTDLFEEDKSVVLSRVTLDLHVHSNDTPTSGQQSNDRRDPLPVSLESFSALSADRFSISLRNLSTLSAVYIVATTTDPEYLDSLKSLLGNVSALEKPYSGTKRSTAKPGACFCRSLLSQSSLDQHTFRLVAEVRWLVGLPVAETLGPQSKYGAWDMKTLAQYFPGNDEEDNVPWSLSDFYDSVYVPPNNVNTAPQIARALPETLLYPFQQRAVDWTLRREGVAYPESGGSLSQARESLPPPVSFRAEHDADGKPIYVSQLRGLIVTNLDAVNDSSQTLRGGILAEEMGLGKTVELIALICQHKRDLPEGDVLDAYTGTFVKPSPATLIITPPSLMEQWKNEINTHAPDLKVKQYNGIPPPSAPPREHAEATVENLMKYDVVLTTYNVLSREIHFATPPPSRPRRREQKYKPRKSPLVQISWWRVCLDEAQMVESGVSNAATVARIIPRCNAWAVSGTPLRRDIQDLRGLLIFLRYEPFAGCKAVWDRLDKPSFRAVFKQIALRHTKDKIRDELRLPPQKRVVITVPFTAIEEQNYSEMIRQMCEVCGFSEDGSPLQEDWDPNHPAVVERMREWLQRLRQTCLHAQVGRRNRKALGAKNGPLRTVHEVLEIMIEKNDTQKKEEARKWVLSALRQGHIVGNDGSQQDRASDAKGFYQEALTRAEAWVHSCRQELEEERLKLGIAGVDDDVEGGDDPQTENQDIGRIPAMRRSLRTFLELEHACKFFLGTAYYQIKSNDKMIKPNSQAFDEMEKMETEWYDKAKAVRQELLKEIQGKAQQKMNTIGAQKSRRLSHIADLPDLGGIEGTKVLDLMDAVSDLLNKQRTQLEIWRQKIIDILLLPLVDEDHGKETTGDEYEDSTKAQDELYVYVKAFQTLIADRNTTLNGLYDHLIDHEFREDEKRARLHEGHAPELLLEIANVRQGLKPTEETGSLKGVVAAARSLITSLQWKADGGDRRAASELAIVQKQFTRIQKIATEEAKAITELQKEHELFSATMNQRLEFYRQLQHISDTVAPWKEELDEKLDERALTSEALQEVESKKKLDGFVTKDKYLINLRNENQGVSDHQCAICLDIFEIGVLTSCGHKFCKECICRWWHAHKTCPMRCGILKSRDFTDISFKPDAIKAHEEPTDYETHDTPSQASSPSSHTPIYSDISGATMQEIKMIDLDGSYGTKVDMIARHLLWIRKNDPGAKSIIFSQFGDFLHVLREALKRWKIGTSSISEKNGIAKFRSDPAVECFLLDAKSDSSGLNLVNSTYVFICEPLINPAIELQAIARVHRIGQQRATTVFMYLVSDTVEEAIYDISVARRMEHMGKASKAASRSGSATPAPDLPEKTLDAANSLEMQAAPLTTLLRKKGEGEVVRTDDIWACLFAKPRKQKRAVLEREVDRHLRGEAAEARRDETAAGS